MSKSGKQLTQEEFYQHLKAGKKCFMRKDRSWQKIHFYWENKEQWFMNQVFDIRENKVVRPHKEKGVWIIAKDLPNHINHLERQGYKYFIKIDEDE